MTPDEIRAPCDPANGGCGDSIDSHPPKVVRGRYSSRCVRPGCSCRGYVTPLPPPPGAFGKVWGS
jgi:hypothetical protein